MVWKRWTWREEWKALCSYRPLRAALWGITKRVWAVSPAPHCLSHPYWEYVCVIRVPEVGVFPNRIPSYFLRWQHLLNLETIDLATLGVLQDPETLPSVSHCWDYKCILWRLTFYMGEASPQPLFCFAFNAFSLALTCCQSVFIIMAEKLLGP